MITINLLGQNEIVVIDQTADWLRQQWEQWALRQNWETPWDHLLPAEFGKFLDWLKGEFTGLTILQAPWPRSFLPHDPHPADFYLAPAAPRTFRVESGEVLQDA